MYNKKIKWWDFIYERECIPENKLKEQQEAYSRLNSFYLYNTDDADEQ